MRNMLLDLRISGLQNLSTDDLYAQVGSPSTAPVKRRDGGPVAPHAPPEAVYPLLVDMPSNTVLDPKITIADYGTAFLVSEEKTPQLHTFPHYRPPEIFFGQPPTLAADVWTLGVNLYEVMGERPLFEVFGYNSDDIIAEMVSTLGPLPEPWWSKWQKRRAFFDDKGSWAEDYSGLADPISRPLRQRLWEMGRGESPDTCSWDVTGGEMRALEDMFRGMLTYEPAQRWTSEQLMASEYMTRWALPAWEEQLRREASRLG
jgi:serine/threonine-protein kinase SRPK3